MGGRKSVKGSATPLTHAGTHENGGTDEIDVGGLSGELADNQPPKDHASAHEDTGGDEISVAGLSGELADNQPPKAHKASHETGGSDILTQLHDQNTDTLLQDADNDTKIQCEEDADEDILRFDIAGTERATINASGLYILQINAKDANGLKLYDDGGNGIFVEDGGKVGIGTLTPAEKLDVFPDANYSAQIGRAHIGHMGISDYAGFSHVDSDTSSSYALLQEAGGTTFINSAATKSIYFRIDNLDKMLLNSDGELGILTPSPTTALDINSDILRLRTAKTPASAGAAGDIGSITWDPSYIYICTATNTWKRVAISTW